MVIIAIAKSRIILREKRTPHSHHFPSPLYCAVMACGDSDDRDDRGICSIERGEYITTEKTAEKLARALDVGVDWLLTGDEKKKEHPVDGKLTDWLCGNIWRYGMSCGKGWKRMPDEILRMSAAEQEKLLLINKKYDIRNTTILMACMCCLQSRDVL